MDTWRTAIVDAGPDHIRVRGHDVLELKRGATFTELIFLGKLLSSSHASPV